VVGYLAVSGRLPFETPSLPALLVRQATEAPPSVLRAAPGLPRLWAPAIDRCLARDPADRFPDGEALAGGPRARTPDARPRPAPTLRALARRAQPDSSSPLRWDGPGAFGTLTVVNLAFW
jgi:serine/threonine-protein kinase